MQQQPLHQPQHSDLHDLEEHSWQLLEFCPPADPFLLDAAAGGGGGAAMEGRVTMRTPDTWS